MKVMTRLFALGLGAACGVGALVAFAPSDVEVEVVEPSVVAPPTSVEVEGTLPSETSTPEVTPSPSELPTEDTTCHEEDPCWDPQTMGNGLGTLPETEPTPDRTASTTDDYLEPPTTPGTAWHGLLVGDVIVCPAGLEVSIDVTPAGAVWAACM